MKNRKPSTSRSASRPWSPKAKAGKARTKARKKAKARPKKPRAVAAGRARASRLDAPSVPAFLTPRQFKKLAEMTRRQRISQARTKTAIEEDAGRPRAVAARAARPVAPSRKVWDYSIGFDPQDDD